MRASWGAIHRIYIMCSIIVGLFVHSSCPFIILVDLLVDLSLSGGGGGGGGSSEPRTPPPPQGMALVMLLYTI